VHSHPLPSHQEQPCGAYTWLLDCCGIACFGLLRRPHRGTCARLLSSNSLVRCVSSNTPFHLAPGTGSGLWKITCSTRASTQLHLTFKVGFQGARSRSRWMLVSELQCGADLRVPPAGALQSLPPHDQGLSEAHATFLHPLAMPDQACCTRPPVLVPSCLAWCLCYDSHSSITPHVLPCRCRAVDRRKRRGKGGCEAGTACLKGQSGC